MTNASIYIFTSLLSLCFIGKTDGFILPTSTVTLRPKDHDSFSMQMITEASMVEEISSARFAFWMCFYGAAGVGSIGRELIPIVFGRYEFNRNLASDTFNAPKVSSSDKSQDLDLKIWGYPEKIYSDEVKAILNNPLSPDQIAKKYPIESFEGSEERYEYTHITKPIFLSYDAYVKANPRANPVALRAVFDSFSNSIGGGNAVSPIIAQERIDLYKNDVKKMAQKLNSGKFLGISAFLLVLTLLGLADYLAIYHIWRGWFPEWQGFSNMPESLFSQDTGIFVLPQYFISDLPNL